MAQFVLVLILGLALLTWAASGVVQTTAREWFERDVSSRSRLVLIGGRHSLANAWNSDGNELQNQLIEISRDERVMGVAACNADLSLRASTQAFPNEFGCWVIGSRARATEDKTTELREWSTVATLPSGRVYVSVMPIANAERQLGFVILLHDLSYIEQR